MTDEEALAFGVAFREGRRKQAVISEAALTYLLQDRSRPHRLTIDGIPENAHVVGVSFEGMWGNLVMSVVSPDFERVPANEFPPRIHVDFHITPVKENDDAS